MNLRGDTLVTTSLITTWAFVIAAGCWLAMAFEFFWLIFLGDSVVERFLPGGMPMKEVAGDLAVAGDFGWLGDLAVAGDLACLGEWATEGYLP
jgi:hypothetical protein